jgi:hypothetical protein
MPLAAPLESDASKGLCLGDDEEEGSNNKVY